jgi:hypothetical protein
MKNIFEKNRIFLLIFTAAIYGFLALCGCGSDNTTGPVTDRVIGAYPLALGNTWEYTITMSIFVHEDTTKPPISLSTTGRQVVEIKRTEMITGDEAFGVTYHQDMGRLFDPVGRDTTIETQYLARRGDKVLLKAIEGIYSTGGFIPLASTPGEKKFGIRMKIGGVERFITLENLARLLLNSAGAAFFSLQNRSLQLSSDGVQNKDNVFFYDKDYIFVFNELFKGKRWTSVEAQSVGGLEIAQKVTNILPELSGINGPIAEVEVNNKLIEAASSLQYKQRYYYKGGVGIVQAEIYDPGQTIAEIMPDGSIVFLGVGTWSVVKKLETYSIK